MSHCIVLKQMATSWDAGEQLVIGVRGHNVLFQNDLCVKRARGHDVLLQL